MKGPLHAQPTFSQYLKSRYTKNPSPPGDRSGGEQEARKACDFLHIFFCAPSYFARKIGRTGRTRRTPAENGFIRTACSSYSLALSLYFSIKPPSTRAPLYLRE